MQDLPPLPAVDQLLQQDCRGQNRNPAEMRPAQTGQELAEVEVAIQPEDRRKGYASAQDRKQPTKQNAADPFVPARLDGNALPLPRRRGAMLLVSAQLAVRGRTRPKVAPPALSGNSLAL